MYQHEDATTPSATVASASRSHSVSPSPSPSQSLSSRSPSIVGSGGSRNRSITPLPPSTPNLPATDGAAAASFNAANQPSVIGASPSHRPVGAPLDSHIADVLQSISLTSTTSSSHTSLAPPSAASSTLASHAGPPSSNSSQQRTIRLITLPSLSTSNQQKQKHSPRRRKQQQQEVDIDEDEDAQAGKKDEPRNGKSARTATVSEVSTAANLSSQLPQLPSPDTILRIPLPSSARGQLRASVPSTAEAARTTSSSDPSSNMEEDDQSHSSMRHLHKKARHVPMDSNHDAAQENANNVSPLKPAAADSSTAGNTISASSNVTDERQASDTTSATTPSVPSAPSSSTSVIKCEICNKLLSSPAQLADHQQGRKHQHMLEIMASGGSLQCTICDKTFTSTLDQSKHMESAGHKANINFLQQKDGAAMLMSPPQRSTSGNVSVASSASSAYSFPANNYYNPPLLPMQPQQQPFPSSNASSSMGPISGQQLFFCPLCRIRTTDSNSLAHHYASRKHLHAIHEAQNQAMRVAQQQPLTAFAASPAAGMNPFQNPAHWQQWQMQVYLQQQQQQQMQPANPFSPAPYGGMPMYGSSYPPFATGPYPMMNLYSGTPPNDLIHEEEESQPQMDEDSIAAGLQHEYTQRQTQPPQNPAPTQSEAITESTEAVESEPTATVDEVVPNNSTDEKTESEAAPTIARPSVSTSAPSTPTIRFLSSSTVTPESVEGPHAEDNTNSSRKRKYGRYSPGFNQRQSNYAGVPRPRLGHSPVQQQLSPFHPLAPPSPQKHSHFTPQPPSQFGCSCDDPRNFPFSPPMDTMSVASSVSGSSSPVQPEFQQYGPNQCAVHGPHHQPTAGVSAVYPQSMPSNWNPSSAAPIAPHPECRAAHYIFVPYPVPVPANNFPQQQIPPDMNLNTSFNWWHSPYQSAMPPPSMPQPSLPSFHAPFHLPQRSAHELSGMAQHWQQQQQIQPSKRHSNKTHASSSSSSAVAAHHLPQMNPSRTMPVPSASTQ